MALENGLTAESEMHAHAFYLGDSTQRAATVMV